MNVQRGAAPLEVLLIIIVVIIVAIFAKSIGGAVVDDFKVNRIISNIVKNLTPEARTDYQVISAVEAEFAKQNISDISPKDILVVRADSLFSVQKRYEIRRPLFGPLDIVIHFDKSFQP